MIRNWLKGACPMALALVLAAPGAARAEGWAEYRQPDLSGAIYAAANGDLMVLVGCKEGGRPALQVTLPEGSKARAGRQGSVSLAVDGRSFGFSGEVMALDDGAGKVIIATIKASDPLLKALGAGTELKVAQGGASYVLPLAGAGPAVASFQAACGPKPRGAAAEAAAAPAQTPPPPDDEAKPAPAAPADRAERAKPQPLPSNAELADAIFVDKQEGRRVAGKLKVSAVDLNGDGANEAIVTVTDPGWCGENGCTILVVDFTGGQVRTIGEFIGQSLTPGKGRTGEWRDLVLRGPTGQEVQNYVDGRYR
ncbi:hypothetical protein [Xanthobacter tagetidis]|uniref:VCBS repeat-containing protein n=1 Tax=Xanthobacter tagetidis TaxID=60216 RepID=A0A3L7A6H3_9HYPH|nr:hypothetical protein [Xanthobacter tagetidis]MBB6308742.1 hypothetical protein [Xanthobacter tagetidis]RLP75450.1 hypothetical protein D9R14_16950 [Xanthobacter tagetidis]